MKTRVRQIDKDDWIVEYNEGFGIWKRTHCEPFKTKGEAESFALYHSKSYVVHAEFEDGERLK